MLKDLGEFFSPQGTWSQERTAGGGHVAGTPTFKKYLDGHQSPRDGRLGSKC